MTIDNLKRGQQALAALTVQRAYGLPQAPDGFCQIVTLGAEAVMFGSCSRFCLVAAKLNSSWLIRMIRLRQVWKSSPARLARSRR